eukprot:4331937-Amphidinium_carterae.1
MRENNEVNTRTLRLELSVAMSEQAQVFAAYLCRRSRRQSKLTDEISHSEFMEIIAPTFDSKIHHVDLKAILKRAHVIVMGTNAVYVRVAGAVQKPVKVVRYLDGVGLLRDDRVDVLDHYKEHGQ